MATKVDAVAAKKRQQIIILAVGGVLLAGLVMLQAPKLRHHGQKATSASSSSTSSSSATADSATGDTPSTPSTSTPSTGTSSTPATTVPVTPTVGHGPAAKVAGVVVRSAGAPLAQPGQLWTLSRFKVHDPFIQQVSDKSSSGSPAATAGGASGAANGGTAGSLVPPGSIAKPTTSTPAPLAYATLMVNGRAQQLTTGQLFPAGQPTFVLRAVGKKFIMVSVAGGKFVGGAVVKLQFGQRVTLMNTATGQRFVMKLVYTGPQPEQIAGFKAPTTPAQGATTPATGSTTPAQTTTGTAATAAKA